MTANDPKTYPYGVMVGDGDNLYRYATIDEAAEAYGETVDVIEHCIETGKLLNDGVDFRPATKGEMEEMPATTKTSHLRSQSPNGDAAKEPEKPQWKSTRHSGRQVVVDGKHTYAGVKEAALAMGVSPMTVYGKIGSGKPCNGHVFAYLDHPAVADEKAQAAEPGESPDPLIAMLQRDLKKARETLDNINKTSSQIQWQINYIEGLLKLKDG